LVSHTRERSYIESVREQGAEKNIWTKGREMAEGWRRLHNEELYNLNISPNIIRLIISSRMRWAGNVACMG